MRGRTCLTAGLLVVAASAVASAAQIRGEYLEARTCDVYTGPCFANAEMDLAGHEAVMAWKVKEGSWNNVSLNGLGAAVVVTAERTLGATPVFPMKAGKMSSVILVDDRATAAQRDALVGFVKEMAKDYTANVRDVFAAPISLENDHLSGVGRFSAGELARIETRGMKKGDCVCTNEEIFYVPLTKVYDYSPAYANALSYEGNGLDRTWTANGLRSAFLATFRK